MFKIVGSNPEDYRHRNYKLQCPIREEHWQHLFRICQALWKFRTGQCGPHVVLPDGRHCDGYLNVARVMQYPWFSNLISDQLIMEMVTVADVRSDTRLVISSGDTSVAIAQAVATALHVPCYVMKRDADGNSVWEGPKLTSADTILQVYDLIARLGTDLPCAIDKDRNALRKGNPGVALAYVPVVGTVVSLAPSSRVDNHGKLAYVRHYQFHSWQPPDCPYCKVGSLPLEPTPENWSRLMTSSSHD